MTPADPAARGCCASVGQVRAASPPAAAGGLRPSIRLHATPLFALLLLAGCGSPAAPAPPPPPAAPADIGRDIYLRGVGANGQPVTAALPDGLPLPAAAVACANCHGPDGRGRPEGGVSPTDITPANLRKPYGGSQPNGRRFPPYDDRLVVRAVTLGADSAGRPLAPTMPRYQLTHDEAAALVAYLARLGGDAAPGVSATEVRVGLATPPGEAAGVAVRAVVEAAFARLNAAGGVYGRRVVLVHGDAGSFTDVVALVGGLADQAPGVLAAAERDGVPVVGVIGPPGATPTRTAYHLFAGPDEQCRALGAFAAETHRRNVAVVGANLNPALAAAVRAGWGNGDGLRDIDLTADRAEAVAAALKRDGTTACVIVAPTPAATAFARAAAGWRVEMLIPAELAGAALAERPPDPERWTFAFPTLRADHTPAALAEYAALARTHALPADHRATQLAALAAVRLTVEAFNRCGRELTRERLTAALDGGAEFATGLTPPLRFGPDRRAGARGAYLARPGGGGSFVSVGGWRERP